MTEISKFLDENRLPFFSCIIASMKVALVHDYINEFGGAERVLESLSELYPEAPIYTIFAKKNSSAYKKFKNKKIIESWFSFLPFANKLISPLRFLIPSIWNSFDFSEYDIVITSASWAITKGMKKGPKTKEICYLHTPPRYLYGYDTSRNWQTLWFAKAVKAYALVVNHFMRLYDAEHAQKVDCFIANSINVGKRIEKFYRRKDYEVIYPPTEVEKFMTKNKNTEKKEYYLTGGRLVAAKNFDQIIKACKSTGKKLKIFGSGLLEEELKKAASANIEFVGHVTDEELIRLYQNARAFVVAQKDEDFGITPIEAAAAGCPTIAFRAEGYLETVVEGKTGIFFDELTGKSIENAMKKFEKMTFKKEALENHAAKFSKKKFKEKIKEYVSRVYSSR
jgi:glycosyltransferase involved in cell wall biosynthesis